MSQAWPLRRVGLRVRDLVGSIAYYQRLGLRIVRDQREEGLVGLGVGAQELLALRHTPDAAPRAAHTAGLYHFAILLPDESALGTFLLHCMRDGVPIAGASDHLVSQALYLTDPEGNGIEVYADRPRSAWPRNPDGAPSMDTLRLKTDLLLAKAQESFTGFPEGTILGHMHLNVRDLDESLRFYQQTFQLELMANLFHQAGFVSWDGYHHHLGLNVWTGPNAAQHEARVAGLDFFEMVREGLPVGTLQDPNGITVIVSAPQLDTSLTERPVSESVSS